MSADNWAECPRCRYNEETRVAELQMRATKAYGVLSVEDFDAMRAEAAKPIDENALITFREDYEFYGAEEGDIKIRYAGECMTCGLKAEFTHEESFYP